ncbi:uncharacterized protein LOC114277685 [Camellia sinensis]|uniref:uncharacterized protein LOC114277685 n=1 Tax=Camellia sinensis TaxID=4442 RepID=UPI001036647E|nr:uncharacterized protein LOC114277685 [Camellia sinensis]
METILNRDTAKHIWDSLKQKYQGSTRVKRAQLQALRKVFEVLQMKEGESVDAYFARTLIIANKMKIHGENMPQVGSLLVHKQRMNGHGGDEQALKVTYDDRIGGRGGSRAHGAFRGRGRGRGRQAFNKATVECCKCHQLGREDVWFLDSGCSNHMCANKEWFFDLDEEFWQLVKLENNSKMVVLGKGNIRLQIAGIT